jgi:uncharacterized protein (DUF58 family)
MRPTRRGYAVIFIVFMSVSSATLFGARGLNAIAGPSVVAIAYAAFQVWRVDEPTVERTLPRRGEQGTTIPVAAHIDAERPYSAHFEDDIGKGLVASGYDHAVTVGGEPIEYELGLRRRGDRHVGPATIQARDVLGLISRTFQVAEQASILVRPPVYPLSGPRADELVWEFGGGDDRQQFDFLRHYRRGDPLRDIHWPSSAKVPGEGLVVKHFSTDDATNSIRIAGESEVGHADEMAAAVASLAVHLVTAGHRIELATADAALDARGGAEQRDRVLDALARTRGGTLTDADRREADVLISAGSDGVTVRVGEAVSPFADVAGREISVPSRQTAEGGHLNRISGLA